MMRWQHHSGRAGGISPSRTRSNDRGFSGFRSYVRLQLHRGDRRRFGPGHNPYQLAEAAWYRCNANAQAFLASVPEDRRCTVRYEDLSANPDASLRMICEMLRIDFEAPMVDPYSKPGAAALGAGDLMINLLKAVEHRPPTEPFYRLGSRCQQLVTHFGYRAQ